VGCGTLGAHRWLLGEMVDFEELKKEFFERRGREGYAKNAEEDKERELHNSFVLMHSNLVSFLVFLFCVLCVTFAPSAFKKGIKKLVNQKTPLHRAD
jgi:hypothetical protein